MTDLTNGGEVPERDGQASMPDADVNRRCEAARPLALRFARKMVAAAHVEDVTHEAVLRLMNQWRNSPPGFDPPRALAAVVYGAVEQAAASFIRGGVAADKRDARFGSALSSATPAWMDPERSLETAELDRDVLRSYSAIPKDKREAHIMVREDGMTIAEAAAALGKNEKTIRRWLHETEQVLLEQLKKHLPPGFGLRGRGNTTKGPARIESRRTEATGDIQ